MLLLRFIFPISPFPVAVLEKKKKSIFVCLFCFFGWVLFSWSIVATGEEFCSRRSLLATHKLLLEAKQSASSSRGHELQTLFFFFSFFFFFLVFSLLASFLSSVVAAVP